MSVQFIKSPSGDELAVLPRDEYDRLVEIAADAEEDAADIAAYDAAKADLSGSAGLPHAVSQAVLKGRGLLAALRAWRELTQVELARRSGISQGYLSDLEGGRRSASIVLRGRLAIALDVPPDWIP